jgi:hypothetical protein
MKKHYVVFYSPGTFFAEQSTKEIKSWDIKKAKDMVKGIKERYNAIPYGFQFITKSRGIKDLDSKVIKQSPMYYLGGEVLTLKQVIAKNDPKDKILISNMENNGYKRIVINRNSWMWTQPLKDDDIVLDFNIEVK